MNNVLLSLLAVALGGLISWWLTYEYWRKENLNKTVTESAHKTLPLDPLQVWDIVTSLEFKSYLDWRGEYEAPPSLFEKTKVSNGLYDRAIYFQFIDKPNELHWGGNPAQWDHKLTLQPLKQGSRIHLERVFWPYIPTFINYALNGFKKDDLISSNYALVKADIERICLHINVIQRSS